MFEALHAFKRAIALHEKHTASHNFTSFKQDILLYSARLLYMQGNEDEAVRALEESIELTVAMAHNLCATCHQVCVCAREKG